LFNLFAALAEAEHDAGLGREAAGFGVAQHGTRAVVTGLHAHGLLQAFDGFDVVVVNVGLGVEHGVDLIHAALEVGHKHLDGRIRIAVTHGADGRRPDAGAAIGEFIAGDGRDDAVLEIHLGHGVGDTGRFGDVVFGRPAGLNRAEIAGAGADVAQNHDRGSAARPAFAEVGALRAFTDGVQLVFVHELAHGRVAGAGGQFGAEPGGFTR